MRSDNRDDRQRKSLDARMQEYAARRYGVVTRKELLYLGFSSQGISRRVTSGMVVPLRPGVLRVAAAPTSWLQSMYAICRWLEPHVVASHRAAAAIWGLGGITSPPLEVTVSRAVRRATGVIIHRTDVMPSCDRRERKLIPVTDPTRTAIDCCAVLSDLAAESVIDDTCYQRLTTSERLADRVEALGSRGRNGLGRARKLVTKRIREGERPESLLTRKLLRLIQASRLPNPVSLHPISLPSGVTLHPDLAYPWVKIAIEADSYKHHTDDGAWQTDRDRDNPLQVLGWIVLRFTWYDVTNRPGYVIATIAAALEERGVLA